jgi:hypothetical protein
MTIPDDIADDIDPSETGTAGCLLPTGDAVKGGDDDE